VLSKITTKLKIILVIGATLILGGILFVETEPPEPKSLVGQPAPNFVVEKWLTPEPDRTGKFVLLDFWATWCPPCVEGIPHLNALQKNFAGQLVVIGVSDETEETVRAFKRFPIEYSSAIDPDHRMILGLGVDSFPMPYTMIIDPRGIVRYQDVPNREGHELTEQLVADLIAKYSN
jgi:cytochrome c biogenesis protein CcmG, thiol:disulfide interchange protein DsbE